MTERVYTRRITAKVTKTRKTTLTAMPAFCLVVMSLKFGWTPGGGGRAPTISKPMVGGNRRLCAVETKAAVQY